MSKFRELVKAFINPVAEQYKNDKFVCELTLFDSVTHDKAIDFIRWCKSRVGLDPAKMGEENFFRTIVVRTDGYWGYVPIRLMTTDFILPILEVLPSAVTKLPTSYMTGNPDVLNYIKNNMENVGPFKYIYNWLIEKDFLHDK